MKKRYLLILEGLKITFIISACAAGLGSILGASICYMRMSAHRLLSASARIYIELLRGIPVLVLLMLIFYVVFASVHINPVIVAIIAFGMNFGGYTAEIYRSDIASIDKGQTEAGIALGFTGLKTFQHIVMPQVLQRILPVYKGELISLVKMTSVVGYISVQDLARAGDIIRRRTFDAFFPLMVVALLYFLISWFLIYILGRIEQLVTPRPGTVML